jgi:hypothetical protein
MDLAWKQTCDIMQVPETNLKIYRLLIFDKESKTHTTRERQPFQQMVLGKIHFHI